MTFALVAGALLGLCAPGLGAWYLAWIGLAPLLYLALTARTSWSALTRGWCFGFAFNLLYLAFVLNIRQEYTTGYFAAIPTVLSVLAWATMAWWQGLFIGIFSALIKVLPLTGGWLPARKDGKWLWPTFVIAPLLWILCTDKFGNAPSFLGMPWSMLQYSQYQQLPVMQFASIVGGIGLCALIVLVNAAIAGVIGWQRPELRAVSYPDKRSLVSNTLSVMLLLAGVLVFGCTRLDNEVLNPPAKTIKVAAIQTGLLDKVPSTTKKDRSDTYLALCRKLPPSLVVWPEWALSLDTGQNRNDLLGYAKIAGDLKQEWVMGVCERKPGNTPLGRHEYNAVCGLQEGSLLPEVYYKRFLVPFGEYVPDWVRYSTLGLALYGSNGWMEYTDSGTEPVILKMKSARVSPVICCENLMPNYVADGVRNGAELITDSSNTSWFKKSILGDQLVSFSVMRAVENHRPFVFATVLGPSAIVDAVGHVINQTPREKAATIVETVRVPTDITPFTRYSF